MPSKTLFSPCKKTYKKLYFLPIMTRRRELGENKEERLSQKLQKKLFEQQRAVILLVEFR